MMSHPIHPDDPRLTAYALGELTEPERAEIERQLADNAECRAYVHELRELAGQIAGSLAEEPAVDLTPAQHTRIEEAAAVEVLPTVELHPSRRRSVLIRFSAGVIAMLLLVCVGTWLSFVQQEYSRASYFSDSSLSHGPYETPIVSIRQADAVPDEAEGQNADNLSLVNSGASMAREVGMNSDSRETIHSGNMVTGKTGGSESARVATARSKGLTPHAGPTSDLSIRVESTAQYGGQQAVIRAGDGRTARGSTKNQKAWMEAEAAAAKANRVSVSQRGTYTPIAPSKQPAKSRPADPTEVASAEYEKMIRDQKERERQLKIAKEPSAQETPSTAGEAYAAIADNPFLGVIENPLSTFSIDVDTASYANVRRFLMQGQSPPPAAVRIEELLNYFSYDYPQPQGDVPFSVNMEVAQCPWSPAHHLLRVGLKGKEVQRTQRPVSNLVFLLDVSGSMQDQNKLPLVKTGMQMLVDNLSENDRVAIVVYAGASGLVLDSTTADKKQVILSAIENLQAGGSTNGGAGIELAYRLAAKNFIKGGTNRVILCTDGDFNVGTTHPEELVRMVTEKAKAGTFLTVLGFGMGNLKDSTLEQLADRGNGNYAYIDSLQEAKKVLVDQLSGTLVTIAKDVKIQIEFNPAHIASYRLLGYENRLLAAEDFHDDTKDAGEVGAGHTVTALYELVPAGAAADRRVDPLKYQPNTATPAPAPGHSKELLTLKLRYKQPDADTSRLLEFPVADRVVKIAQASPDFAWAASVASFGMILRHSPHRGESTLPAVLEMAEAAKGADQAGYRAEFIQLVRQAQTLGAK